MHRDGLFLTAGVDKPDAFMRQATGKTAGERLVPGVSRRGAHQQYRLADGSGIQCLRGFPDPLPHLRAIGRVEPQPPLPGLLQPVIPKGIVGGGLKPDLRLGVTGRVQINPAHHGAGQIDIGGRRVPFIAGGTGQHRPA